MEKAILKVDNITARYGPVEVLHGITMQVNEGEIVSLLGANGAGKTTLLNCICGLHSAKEGKIWFRDTDITGIPAELVVPRGWRTCRSAGKFFHADRRGQLVARRFSSHAEDEQKRNRQRNADSLRALSDPGGAEVATRGNAFRGQQQMLAIGRALLSRPQLLLLDEPSLGLAPLIAKEILTIVQEIRSQWGTTVLLVEQNARAALAISDRAYVLSTGEVMLEGSAEEISNDPRVQSAYLGHSHQAV